MIRVYSQKFIDADQIGGKNIHSLCQPDNSAERPLYRAGNDHAHYVKAAADLRMARLVVVENVVSDN